MLYLWDRNQKMKPYKFIPTPTEHSVNQIFENYGVKNEVDFVKDFFSEEENIMSIITECGLEKPQTIEEFVFEYPVKLGISSYRADLFVKTDVFSYYFEVMSKANKGIWDQDHHQQFILKNTKLNQMYDNVKSFAISFGEFDPRFSEDICLMNNTFGVHLSFTDQGYKVNVVCKEQKTIQNNVNNDLCRQFWTRALPEIKKATTLYNTLNITQNTFVSKTLNKVVGINSVISQSFVRIEVYIDRQEKYLNKEVFNMLISNKEPIEKELGYELSWEILEDKNASRISIQQNGDYRNKDQWSEMIDFITTNIEKFQKTFSKYL